MKPFFRRMKHFLDGVKREERSAERMPLRCLQSVLRTLLYAAKKFRRDLCLDQAAALSFISILSLIPLGFLFFFFMRAFRLGGYWDQLKEWILRIVSEKYQESIMQWLGVFEKNPLSTISSIPYYLMVITGLIFSALWLFEASEKALNRIWGTGRNRSYLQRFTVFWLIVTASPFLLAFSTFLKTSLESNPGIQRLMQSTWLFEVFYGFFVPVAVAALAFFFVYLLLPAARVKILPALAGAVFAAVFWEIGKSALAYVIPQAVTFKIYGSLGAIAAFLFWFYLSWVVLLFGAQISFVVQYPDEVALSLAADQPAGEFPPGLLALGVAVEAARAAQQGKPPPTLPQLAQKWAVPPEFIRREVTPLLPHIFHRAAGDDEIYYLSRDSDSVLVREFLADRIVAAHPLYSSEGIGRLCRLLQADLGKALGNLSVRDLLNRKIFLRQPEPSQDLT